MWITSTIVTACFLGVIAAILTDKLNRAIASVSGAIVTYFALVFIENHDYTLFTELLFGSTEDGFVNLHSLLLIVGIMMIVAVANEAGVFQFLAVKLIKMSQGRPISLLGVLCFITVLISSVLNNISTIILLIPLTITISRILNIDPTPYILSQAILVNIGGTVLAVSSIPNILIVNSTGITFSEFFLNVGVYSIVVFGFTLGFFVFLYKDSLKIPPGGVEVLREFDAWNFVADRRLMQQSLAALIILVGLFVLVPADLVPPDILAISVAIGLILMTRIDPKIVLGKIDVELLLYLMGIFVIAGAMEITGIVAGLTTGLSVVIGQGPLRQVVTILWLSAVLSSSIDSIPITQILIPIVETYGTRANFYALVFGTNWGDNLTPMGDNVLVMNIAAQNKRPIKSKLFFKLGFFTTIFQLSIITLIMVFRVNITAGLILAACALCAFGLVAGFWRFGSQRSRATLDRAIQAIKQAITT
jgi:Na+/H+ antiporter NhaD/arsenite permease-like protein